MALHLCISLHFLVLLVARVLEYCSGNQGRKNERDCLRPLSGEVRHKNANPPSEGGYERVGKSSQVAARGERLSGKDSLQQRLGSEGGTGTG